MTTKYDLVLSDLQKAINNSSLKGFEKSYLMEWIEDGVDNVENMQGEHQRILGSLNRTGEYENSEIIIH